MTTRILSQKKFGEQIFYHALCETEFATEDYDYWRDDDIPVREETIKGFLGMEKHYGYYKKGFQFRVDCPVCGRTVRKSVYDRNAKEIKRRRYYDHY